jgi:hypothetical protein
MNLFDIETNDSKPKTKTLDFLKLVEGPNRIRLWTTAGEAYTTHWSQSKKRTFRCPGDDCSQCKGGDRAKRKYIVPAIDRADNQIKVLEFGDQVLMALKKFQKELEPADSFFNYDILVTQHPKGSNPLYTVNLKQKMVGTNRDREDDALIRDFSADLKAYVRKTESETENQTKEKQGTPSNYDPNADYQ